VGTREQLQTTVILAGIQRVVRQIVDRFHPQQVILFPLDILVIRPADLVVALQEKNIFETEVANKGVIL
jgi:hypothetical protein